MGGYRQGVELSHASSRGETEHTLAQVQAQAATATVVENEAPDSRRLRGGSPTIARCNEHIWVPCLSPLSIPSFWYCLPMSSQRTRLTDWFKFCRKKPTMNSIYAASEVEGGRICWTMNSVYGELFSSPTEGRLASGRRRLYSTKSTYNNYNHLQLACDWVQLLSRFTIQYVVMIWNHKLQLLPSIVVSARKRAQ